MPGKSAVIAGGAFIKLTLDSMELNKGLEQAQSRMKRFTAAVNAWGTAVGLNAAMIQAPFVKAINISQNFDLKMRQVKAITGATGQAFADLSSQARKLGRDTSFTTEQVSDAMVALGRLGFSVKEVKNAVRPVMNLAKATGSELGDAAMVAGNNMRVFGLDASNMADITDVVVTTVNKSAQSLQDFAEASAKAGPNFVNTGSDIREMSASLGILANMGIRGSIAGTALSRSIKRLADPKVNAFLKTYGIEVEDAAHRMKPLHENLAQIARVMSSLSHAERIHIAEEIFEVRGSLAGLPLAVNVKAIDEFLSALRNCKGESARVAEEMDSGIYGALKRLESAFNDVYISIGKMFSFSFISWIEQIKNWVNELNNADSAWTEMFRYAMQWGTILSVLGAGAKLISMWGNAVKTLFNPILKLNDLITGATQKAKIAADLEQKRSLEATAAAAQRVAAEKAATAATLTETAKREAAYLKEAKARESAAVAELTAGKTKEASAGTAIAKAKSSYDKDYGALEATVEKQREEVKTIEAANRALDKKIVRERQSLDNATEELNRRRKMEANAVAEAEAARRKLEAAKAGNQVSDDNSRIVEERKGNMERLAGIKKEAAANANLAAQKRVELENDLASNEAAIKKKNALIESHKKKYAAGNTAYKGLQTAEEKRLASLRAHNVELTRQLNLQKEIARQAEKASADAARQYNNSVTAYNKISSGGSRSVVDTAALEAEVQKREEIVKTAAEETKAAAQAQIDAQTRHANAVKELNDNASVLASKKASMAGDAEKIASARRVRDSIVVSQEEIKASAAEANIALQAQVKTLHAETAAAEKAAAAAKHAADSATAEAARAQQKAAEAQTAASSFGANSQANAQANVIKAQEEKAAAERIAREKQVTLEKAQETKRQAQLQAELTKSDVANFNEEAAFDDKFTRKRIANANARIEIQRTSANAAIQSQKQVIAVESQVLESQKAKLAALQAEKQAYIDTANAKKRHKIERGRDINVKHYDKELASIQATITMLEKKIAVEEAGNAKIQADSDAAIAKESALVVKLEEEIAARAKLAAVANTKVARAGWQSYLAAEKEIEAQIALEKANAAVAASEIKLAAAQSATRTSSQRYAAVLVKSGQGHMFAAAMSSRHAKQILKTSVADVFAAAKTATGSTMRAAGYAAETVAAKAATVATIAFRGALDFLAANAFTVALLAIVGAISMINNVANKTAKAMNELANKHRIAADNAKEETESTRKMIQSEQEQIQYLVELEKQGNATKEQQEAALSIVDALEKRYGSLGITIDQFTGKLTGAFQAQLRLNNEQKKAMQMKLNAQLAEEQKSAKASMASQGKNALKNGTGFAGFWGKTKNFLFDMDGVTEEYAEMLKKMGYEWHDFESELRVSEDGQKLVQVLIEPDWRNDALDNIENMTDEEIENIRKKIKEGIDFGTAKNLDVSKPKELFEMLDRILATRKQIAETNKGNLTGEEAKPTVPPVKAPDEKELEDAKKRLADMDEKNSQKRMANLDRETAAIQKQRDEYVKYLELLKQGAEAKKQQATANLQDAQSRIEANKKQIAELQASNEEGKNDAEITRLNDEIKTLAKSIEKYTSDIKAQDDNLKSIQAQREAAVGTDGKGGEYGRQLQLTQSEDAKRQKREMEANSNLVNGWVDAQGKRHKGTIFEEQDKQRASRAENEKFQKFMNDKNFSGAMKMMRDLVVANSASMREATSAYNDLLKQAEQGGYYNGTMSEQDKANTSAELSRLAAIIKEAASRDTQLRNQFDEAKKASQNIEQKTSSIGSFSANALSRAIGSDGTQMKMLKTANEQQKILGVVSTNLSLALIQIRALNQRLGILGG